MHKIDALTAKGLIRLGNGRVVAKSEAAAYLAAPRSATPAKPSDATAKANGDADRAKGRDAERKRWATVFAHEASKGQERLAAHLLGQANGFSASQIIAALSSKAAEANAPAPQQSADWADVRADVLQRTGRA